MTSPTSSFKAFLSSKAAMALLGFAIVNMIVLACLGKGAQTLGAQIFQDNSWNTPMYGSWTWWTARGYVLEDPPPDVVLLGSSLMTAPIWAAEAHCLKVPIDCVLHPRAVVLERAIAAKLGGPPPKVINCAIGGAVASDYYLISRGLFTSERKPKLIIIGVSPRDFIDNQLVAANSTEPFRFFSAYVDTGKLSAIAFPDLTARFNAELDWKFNRLPTRRLHQLVEERVIPHDAPVPVEEGRRGHELLGAISNSALNVHPGEWVVPPVMKDLHFDNQAEYVRRFKNPFPPIYPIECAFFSEFLNHARDMNIKVLVVGMPTQARNRNILPPSFWSKYRQEMANLCQRNGAVWIDIAENPSFQYPDFLDTVHMNARGGAKFVDILADAVAKDPLLTACVRATPLAEERQPQQAGSESPSRRVAASPGTPSHF